MGVVSTSHLLDDERVTVAADELDDRTVIHVAEKVTLHGDGLVGANADRAEEDVDDLVGPPAGRGDRCHDACVVAQHSFLPYNMIIP